MPPRGKYIRTLIAEMNRLSSHLVWFGTQGLDMGAMSAMFYGFREREVILDFYEMVTGLRMNNGYFIPGRRVGGPSRGLGRSGCASIVD